MTKTIVSRGKEITIEMSEGKKYNQDTIVGRLDWTAGRYDKFAIFHLSYKGESKVPTIVFTEKADMTATMQKEMGLYLLGLALDMKNEKGLTKMKNMELKDVKAALLKAIKFEEDVRVEVMVYDSNEGEQTYDVEVNYYLDGEHGDTFVTDIFDGEVAAIKRGRAVHKTVKGWFRGWDEVEVNDDVEVYMN